MEKDIEDVIKMNGVKVFRCRICGDPYIGVEPPTRCPFCGAMSKYFVEAQAWKKDEYEVQLTEVSRKNLEKALALELNNSGFYACAMEAAKKEKDEYYVAKFKALMKIEYEHASAICKFLKRQVPDKDKVECMRSGVENSKDGFRRETNAIESYSRFRDEASESRMKEFFNALVEIERDHLELHKKNIEIEAK